MQGLIASNKRCSLLAFHHLRYGGNADRQQSWWRITGCAILQMYMTEREVVVGGGLLKIAKVCSG